jgi:flagella basal body P-ring formation protein FlgA
MTRRRLRGTSWIAAAAGLAALSSAPAFAGQPVSLRANLSSGADVTLGDLFDGAGGAGSVVIGYGAPPGQSAVLDAGAVQRLARLHGLDWDNPNAIRRILVRSGTPPAEAPAPRTIDALAYTRNLATGDIVQPQDIAYAKIAAFALPLDAPRDADAVIGMVVRRPLRAGAPVAGHDVSLPLVIKRDDIVQVIYNSEGISLTLQGKAMAAAAVGEPLGVMNTVSNKVIQAVAVGPDQAVVGPDAERMRTTAVPPAQFAALR